ncbi:hypothetical protein [Enterococcus canintestini]|uniref:hypothetical protein n=1 Tax=Enterococcus canintestini TaxID=317010 RepID=UPI00288D0943|nr:hypothetical protein [Enterococcus canintestini]MDT2739251.1 hypothetical protein [Enterococcus canintestini]
MSEKFKGNIIFVLATILLILAIALPQKQVLFGITVAILVLIALYFEAKVRIKNIIAFFRGQ